jgi:hypothetical protein
MAGQHLRQRRLSGTVRAHYGMHFALVDLKVQAFQYLLTFDTGVQIFNF